MRTTKPISTISFNTEEYLKIKLNNLLKAKIIEEWYYIEHLPEDDEAGKKLHYHVYIAPSKLIQTEDLVNQFLEEDPSNEKPRGVLKFRSSKFKDWYLYGLHNKSYLLSKGQTRVYEYKHEQMVAFDIEQLNFNAKIIDCTDIRAYDRLQEYVDLNKSFNQFVREQNPPIAQIRNYQFAFEEFKAEKAPVTFRNGRQTHSPKELDNVHINEITGELIR